MAEESIIDEATPDEAFTTLETDEDAVLVDVRTEAEWEQVGTPTLGQGDRPIWMIEWVKGPERVPNMDFLREIAAKSGGALPKRMFFICRSGARSAAAAEAVAAFAAARGENVHCTNVLEGFEGLPGATGASGWQARGLPVADRERG